MCLNEKKSYRTIEYIYLYLCNYIIENQCDSLAFSGKIIVILYTLLDVSSFSVSLAFTSEYIISNPLNNNKPPMTFNSCERITYITYTYIERRQLNGKVYAHSYG